MCEPCTYLIALGRHEHLCLVLEPAECPRVNDAVAVFLEWGSDAVIVFGQDSSLAGNAKGCSLREQPSFPIPVVRDDSLRSCKARNRDSRCRAGDVVETRQVAELDGIGVATVLSADTDFNLGVRLAAKNYSDTYKLAHALLINALEGINVQDLGIKVDGQEGSSSIITAVGKG